MIRHSLTLGPLIRSLPDLSVAVTPRTCSVVSSFSPHGPRAWNLSVLMPISAPRPNSPPSLNRVLALTITAALSTRAVNSPGGRQVAGDDRVGVLRAVAVDVLDRLVERVDDLDRNDRAQVLGGVIVLGRRLAPSGSSSRVALVAANFDAAARPAPAPIRGRNSAATSACTSSDSAALQTPIRWHLALIDDPLGHRPDRPARST